MPIPPAYDVAVIGLGPVGAALAAALAGRGLRVVALEKGTAAHALPRAAHLDGWALRTLAEVGVRPDGRELDGFDLVDRRGRLLLRGRPRQAPPPGFPPGLLVHQPSVERALRSRLGAVGVHVRLGHAVAEVGEAGAGVEVGGEGLDGRFAARASFAVGCDGARSAVRQSMGAAWVGGGFEQKWLVVDVRLRRPTALPERLLQIADPARPTTFVPFAGPRRRWEFRRMPGDGDLTDPATVRALLSAHVAPGAVEVERAAVYTFRDVVAERWRRGRVLLAGDAAHQMPPFLGQGLGAGLRDVAALAPLLVQAVRAGSPDGLDAYERARRPHVRATVRQSVRLGRLVTLPEPWATVRDRALRTGLRVPGLGRWLRDVRG